MSGNARRALAVFLALVFSVFADAGAGLTQEFRERRTLFDMLFGPPPAYDDRLYAPSPDEMPRTRKTLAPRDRLPARPQAPRKMPATAKARTEKSAPVAKLENARHVLVIGDFLAGGMGEALSARFANAPAVVVDVRANGSSGLVRTDYYDWFASLTQFIDELKPAAIVVMLGANDRQPMVIGDTKEKFGTELWFKDYERRIDALLSIATRRNIPILWTGLPAFQSPSLSADFSGFNRLYRKHVEKLGGEFVDVWDGFVDEAGKFAMTGYDVNGQQVRLREADGIGMTQAGKEKLAFYVEKFIRRHLDGAGPDLMKLDGSNLPALTSLPALGLDAGQVRTQPIDVTDPDLDGGDVLLGDKPAGREPRPVSGAGSPRERLIRRGEMTDAPLGRVDDYRMPAPNAAAGER